jgi:hypothetical protein
MVQSDAFKTNCHVLHGIALAVSDYLIVVWVTDSVKVEEVFAHLWERFVEGEDIIWFEVGFRLKFALFDNGLSLLGEFIFIDEGCDFFRNFRRFHLCLHFEPALVEDWTGVFGGGVQDILNNSRLENAGFTVDGGTQKMVLFGFFVK